MAKYQGSGAITAADFKACKWIGKTKGGSAITIEFEKAINMGNINWAFADKDDTVAEIVMTAVYKNTDNTATDTKEPWTIDVAGSDSGAKEIMLGAGVFYIEDTAIALTRGGGSFIVERTYREQAADGDMGPVEGRINLDRSVATLTMNVLTILSRVADLYPAMESVN
jgi:hypothetical protein